jgi:hypothetical protein
MHQARIRLKDGTTLFGAIWMWRPQEGYLELSGNEARKIHFDDIAEAIEYGQRTNVNTVKDVDLLERARNEGWVSNEREKR